MTQFVKLVSATNPQRTVIFIHGLGGHPYTTWMSPSGESFWPGWLGEELPFLNIYTVAYQAPLVNWLGTGIGFRERADNILEAIRANPVLIDLPITLICHSLGGIIGKQLIKRASERQSNDKKSAAFLTAIDQIVFLAVPHNGSRYASLLGKIKLLAWPTDATLDLIYDSPELQHLSEWYRNWERVRQKKIEHLDFYETQSTFVGRILKRHDPALPDVYPVPIDANHMSICKCCGRNDLIYLSVKELIGNKHKKFQSSKSTANPPSRIPVRSGSAVPRLIRLAAVFLLLLGAIIFGAAPATSVDLERRMIPQSISCSKDGARKDTMELLDMYTISQPFVWNKFLQITGIKSNLPEFFEKRARIYPNQSVNVYDLGSKAPVEAPSEIISNLPQYKERLYKFSIVKGKVNIKWVWRNGHVEDEDGIYVTSSSFLLKKLIVYYPPHVSVTELQFSDESVKKKCKSSDNFIECTDINALQDLWIKWKWNLWDQCKTVEGRVPPQRIPE